MPSSLDSVPTRGRRANESELGPLVINESEANVGEVDMVQTVADGHAASPTAAIEESAETRSSLPPDSPVVRQNHRQDRRRCAPGV